MSLPAFRKARHPILDRPPLPGTALTEGRAIGDWSAASARDPSLTVVHFVDDKGRERWTRHLIQQSLSLRGTVGQVVYDRHYPEKARCFAVTQQLFDIRPPREIRENPAPHPHTIHPMPPSSRPPHPH
ncbi:hypothetical protein SAMN04489752_1110 [Brevibacterium siliguriense]|uniref:Uncharacterized protein n=1 Tax=Brevibacterium siliguriense TaxID=1136497 RepID=A0A1H1PXR9_9MICO|nr:hypothetical protein [Brevibacterium siliguriense]SDS15950.1 hypothetical protein SAMN04489752_1110 [Brevibacterium siliguriense]